MHKYAAEVQEKAFELHVVKRLTVAETVRKMREEYPKFAQNTLSHWIKDPVLNWQARYEKYLVKVGEKNDKDRARKVKPIVRAVEEIRDDVYKQLIKALHDTDLINERNIGVVLSSFAKLGELEYRIKGGRHAMTPVKEVIGIIFMILEKNPNVRPVITAYRREIEKAIFEEIKGDG